MRFTFMAPIPGVALVRTDVFSVFDFTPPVEVGPPPPASAAPVSLPMPDAVLLSARHLFAALGVDSDLAKRTSLAERRERAGVCPHGMDWWRELPACPPCCSAVAERHSSHLWLML